MHSADLGVSRNNHASSADILEGVHQVTSSVPPLPPPDPFPTPALPPALVDAWPLAVDDDLLLFPAVGVVPLVATPPFATAPDFPLPLIGRSGLAGADEEGVDEVGFSAALASANA